MTRSEATGARAKEGGRGRWRLGPDAALTLDQPRLIGILNVTPDSFSDGGRYQGVDDAVAAALRMHEEGACIIDVGGESTRPGAHPVPADEQIRRTVPVIERISEARAQASRHPRDLFISIDTTHSKVAEAALNAGAAIINDISAGRDDPDMLPLAASRGCGLILMHRLRPPAGDVFSHQYATEPDYGGRGGDVVKAVRQFLQERSEVAIAAGVCRESIVLDPGLGFGKSVEQNYELVRHSAELQRLGFPLLSAVSRKSFIGAVTGQKNPAERVHGSVAISVAHYLAGVRLFRVHDVAAHQQALSVAAATRVHLAGS